MTVPSPAPEPRHAPLTSIRRYLVARIVGIVVFSFLIFSAAAWLIVLRPAQDELARIEMDRAASSVESNLTAQTEQMERVLRTVRDMGAAGVIDIGDPAAFARQAVPILRNRGAVSAILLADEQGLGLVVGRAERGEWLMREIDYPVRGAREHWTYLGVYGGAVRDEWVESDLDPRVRPWFRGAQRCRRATRYSGRIPTGSSPARNSASRSPPDGPTASPAGRCSSPSTSC